MTAARDPLASVLFPLSLALVCAAFWHPLRILGEFWGREEYSHGPLIPLVAVLLGLHRLAETRPTARASWLGLPALGLGGAFLAVGEVSTFNSGSLYGLVLAILGLFLASFGREAAKACRFSFLYVIFCIPMPEILRASLSQDLQILSSSLGVSILDHLGVTVFQEGNVIDLGTIKLQVVEACSGLRYLFPLASFGLLAAYLLQDRLWKRVVLCASVVPITIAMNSLRIAVVGLTVEGWGTAAAEGMLHDFEGWIVFMGCVAVLAAEVALLVRIGRRGAFRWRYLRLARGPFLAGRTGGRGPAAAALLLAAAGAAVVGAGLFSQRPEILPPHQPLTGFPLQLGGWNGWPKSLTEEVLDALHVSDYWLAEYRRGPSRVSVELYVTHYARQRIGSSAHSPSNCIPGGGWVIAKRDRVSLPLAWDGGRPLEITRLVIRHGPQSQLVYYWFDERGRDLTEVYAVKWHLFWDSLLRHRTDGSLIRLITPLVPGESEAEADRRMLDLLTPALPVLKTFLPRPPEGANRQGTP